MAVNPQGSKTGWAHKFLGSFAGVLVAVLMGYSSGVPVAATAAAAPPPSSSTPAPIPELSSSIAGITVTGIIGGSARVALIEIKGQTSVVGVGDRIGALVVRAISGSEVVLGQSDRTIRLPVARAITASAAQPTAGGGPAAAAPVTKAPPAAAALEPPAAAPAGTPANGSPTAATQPAATSTVPQPPTTTFRSVTLGPTGYPQPTSVPVRGVPLSLSTGPSPVLPLGATVYTPSGTSDYGFASAPITTQNTVTPQGATTLPVAASEPAPAAQVLPPGATLYTPSGTSDYGSSNPPITAQSAVTLGGVTALPVAANQAGSTAEVSPWPAYRVQVGPISDQQSAAAIAASLVTAGFTAKVDANASGQYIVTLNPPPQSTVGRGLAMVTSLATDLPIKVELGP